MYNIVIWQFYTLCNARPVKCSYNLSSYNAITIWFIVTLDNLEKDRAVIKGLGTNGQSNWEEKNQAVPLIETINRYELKSYDFKNILKIVE